MTMNGMNGTVNGSESSGKSRLKEPLKYAGSLDGFEHFEVSPVIGREYPRLQLADLLHSDDADTLLRDLAVISESLLLFVDQYILKETLPVSQRGAVFFRSQAISLVDQKALTLRLSQLSGAPEGHGLHVHPLYRSPDMLPVDDKGTFDKNGK